MATITLKGSHINTNGELPYKGSIAPDFILITKELKEVSLETYRGKKKLLNIVPSLDTHVCSISAHKFNNFAKQKKEVLFLTVSADLPFAISRFCSAEQINNIVPLSMMRSKKFAVDYGILIEDGFLAGVCARAVIIIDEDNKIIYTELVDEITQEPNYDAAIAML